MGNDAVSPVPTTTGHVVDGHPTRLSRAVRHVYVIHDDAAFTKIAIGRCFPVAFGSPKPNVSDPSGLDCVDLPVANLGATLVDTQRITYGGAFMFEAVGTWFLVGVVLHTAVRSPSRLAPVAIGMTITRVFRHPFRGRAAWR